MKLRSNKITKGIAFAGCSFTWGQGLYYYSSLPTLREPPPDCYIHEYVTEAHKRYMATIRYPRLVADHFNTWEVVHPYNGGSNFSAIEWWRSSFNAMDYTKPCRTHKQFEYSEFSHVFLQLTQAHRNNFIVEIDGEHYDIPLNIALGDGSGHDPWPARFKRWLDMQNLTYDQWYDRYVQNNINQVKSFLQEFENHGVIATLFTWPDNEYNEKINNDPWLKSRLMTFNYKDHEYYSIEGLMRHNKELEIKHDYSNFIETPKDHHPSRQCHRVIADHIIARLAQQGFV